VKRPGAALSLLAYAIFLLLLAETAARVLLMVRLDASALQPDRAMLGFYPELAPYWDARAVERDDGIFDLLLLGGSVIAPGWSRFGASFAREIGVSLGRSVRTHNLAAPAHTSRDSLLKYQQLAGHDFDLVVVYHGINEVRANNIPPELFRADYSHFSWYRAVDALRDHTELRYTALPFAAHFSALAAAERLGLLPTVPSDAPRADWLDFGSDVKSAGVLRRHLAAIATLAAEREQPLLFLTFASYFPEGFEGLRFLEKPIRDGSRARPLRMWGRPTHVKLAIDFHNATVRALAAQHPELRFADAARELPGDERYFLDVCHLTEAGADRLAEIAFAGFSAGAPPAETRGSEPAGGN